MPSVTPLELFSVVREPKDPAYCVVRKMPNLCSTCGEAKPCGDMQMRAGLPHRHSPGVCKRCRSRKYPSASHRDTCKCGALKMSHSAQCLGCYRSRVAAHPARRVGSTYTTSDGYIAIFAPDHPRASVNGVVFQHRYAMEQALGRYLLKSENVHHINGDRTDNRIENLELWTRPQPTGVRAADAVAAAVEVLRVYAPHLLSGDADGLGIQQPAPAAS